MHVSQRAKVLGGTVTKEEVLKQREAGKWNVGTTMLSLNYTDEAKGERPKYVNYLGIDSASGELTVNTEVSPRSEEFKVRPEELKTLQNCTPPFIIMMLNNQIRR